jgi:hypothetical protein
MRRIYVVPMRWMVIYEYEVPGGALHLSSTKLLRPWDNVSCGVGITIGIFPFKEKSSW